MKEKMSEKGSQWQNFISYFPEIELPVTLSEEYTSIFTRMNKPLPFEYIDNYIEGNSLVFADQEEADLSEEIVEYVPCFSLPPNENFHAIVYWKASLLKYEYIIHTFDPKGKSIAKQVIASTSSDGKKIRQVVATIDADLEINIMGGDTASPVFYNPEKSKAFSMEITQEGHIMHHFDEN